MFGKRAETSAAGRSGEANVQGMMSIPCNHPAKRKKREKKQGRDFNYTALAKMFLISGRIKHATCMPLGRRY